MAADAVAEIKARLDIVEVIGGYVQLTRAGRDLKALCPFHGERTASFRVSPEKQAWHCFGCSEGGDMFTFVEKIERVDFRAALQLLADRAGVELEEHRGRGEGNSAARRRTALELHTRAQEFFAYTLWKLEGGEAGRQLLAQRGLDEATAQRFGVGFAPAGEASLTRWLMTKHGAQLQDLVDAGLSHPAWRGGGGRDRFRNRLVFPIRDERGATIAFGARALGSEPPKYLNSPETAIYHKSTALYGIDHAREAIRDAGDALIVEGYFDVIACHRAGIANVIASSGTALTAEQVKFLSRQARSLTLCFDADEAGQKAASRAVDLIAAAGMPARIVELPAGAKDPDEAVTADADAFVAAVGAARPEWQVLLDRSLGTDESGGLERRREAAERVKQMLARITEATTRDLYVQQAARRLELSPAAMAADVARLLATPGRVPQRVVASMPEARPVPTPAEEGLSEAAPGNPPSAPERAFATLIVHRPTLVRDFVTQGMGISDLRHPHVRHFAELALNGDGQSDLPIDDLSEPERRLYFELLVTRPPELDDDARPVQLARALADISRLVRKVSVDEEIGQVRGQISRAREAGDDDERARLSERLNELARAAHDLRQQPTR